MNKEERRAKQQENLTKAVAIYTLYASPEFQQYLRPIIQKLSTVQAIDPTKYETKEKYEFALDNANREAVVYTAFLKFLDSQEGIMNKLNEELKKPLTTYEG